MKIAITGATGFIGSSLVARLQKSGHQVMILTRNTSYARKIFPSQAFPNIEIVNYTPTILGSWQNAISGCDSVVNLAGESIAEGRWTEEKKQKILQSRQLTTQNLVTAIANAEQKPSVLVNASAIGYYGTSETATFTENSPSGNDFLAEVCQAWEAAAQKVSDAGVRLVILRLGVVLAADGGALAKMITPFKMFAGGPIGSGNQWFSWIHRDDVVKLIIQAVTDSSMSGVYNATAPNPVRMNELSQTMGTVMNRPSWLPVPSFAIEALLGDGAIVVLEGQQVVPKRTLTTGFKYQYPNLQGALTEILD
ncbi:TIGR01777 family oxidoreductase [Calothrix rhizosoleniae]|uniref:thylakoid membrane protein ThyD n=1 Tax=Calothrix rhizosoleniae TaxID=888997 RepID=UPI000B49D48E|nr:TIGR01777 family oxidoreductase [Calothrix rhizosoleniae]